jgi:hypothetical protein
MELPGFPTLRQLTVKIAAKEAFPADLRQLEDRERARVSAVINAECAPFQQQATDQLADGLLTYNAAAEAEWALRDRLIAADVRIMFRPITVPALGRLSEEYSGISLLFRELKEYDLLKAEYEKRAITAGWRP